MDIIKVSVDQLKHNSYEIKRLNENLSDLISKYDLIYAELFQSWQGDNYIQEYRNKYSKYKYDLINFIDLQDGLSHHLLEISTTMDQIAENIAKRLELK